MIIVFSNVFFYALRMKPYLDWPAETPSTSGRANLWSQAGSNICLDFHGDPITAGLVIFSDGNHHMALQETVQVFLQRHPELGDIFYTTTPPRVVIQSMEQQGIWLGNLKLSCQPDVFIGPDSVMHQLHNSSWISQHHAFARSQGNVLLIKKDNPKNISTIADVMRENVRLFMSNPETEKASYQVYYNSLLAICEQNGIDTTPLSSKNIVYGERIHHREAPQAIYSDYADVAIVYYHLAMRYCRIFPDEFDFIPLGGSKEHPGPVAGNQCTEYHVSLLDKAENKKAGQKFVEFLLSEEGSAIYKSHGLTKVSES